MKKGFYAGSFDPLTLGHLDMIERASKLCDELVVGVVINLAKQSVFTFEERVDMVRECTKHLKNVTVESCQGLLADHVNKGGFDVVIRGIRNTDDFNDEQSMAQLHHYLYEKADTVFLMSDSKYSFISSTMAKQVVSLGGDGTNLVPPYVLEVMKGKLVK